MAWTEISGRGRSDWAAIVKYLQKTKGQMNATEYVINQPVAIEENRYYEFKEITSGDPVRTFTNQ